MTRYLLDVNVLIALLDPSHVHHDRAHRWFGADVPTSWLSCPTTQNGVLRIVTNPRYSNQQPMSVVVESLRSLVGAGIHQFVPDDLSLLTSEDVYPDKLLNSSQVTDTYLIALARANQAQLATFDSRLVASAVLDGARAVHQI